MHKYLRAVGFSQMKLKKELKSYVREIVKNPGFTQISQIEGEDFFAQLYKEYAPNMGIMVCGLINEKDEFELEYYYPVLWGSGVTSKENIVVEQQAEKEAYLGVCEDVKVGVSLIFFLQNVCQYKNEKSLHPVKGMAENTTMSALSISGKILFPIDKTRQQIEYTKRATENRNQLIEAARRGDEEAIESLTLEDMDTYSMISRRILKEDVLSLVDNYFMPYGVECDKYSIMGEILNVELVQNTDTNEMIYILKVDTNDLVFDICINTKDLFGEPAIGRRFRGTIWLQGRINYKN